MTEALNGTDVEAIKTATEQLLTSSQRSPSGSTSAASQAESRAPQVAATTAPPHDDEIVDAEIVDEQ